MKFLNDSEWISIFYTCARHFVNSSRKFSLFSAYRSRSPFASWLLLPRFLESSWWHRCYLRSCRLRIRVCQLKSHTLITTVISISICELVFFANKRVINRYKICVYILFAILVAISIKWLCIVVSSSPKCLSVKITYDWACDWTLTCKRCQGEWDRASVLEINSWIGEFRGKEWK